MKSKPLDTGLASQRKKAKPRDTVGAPGTAIYGGYILDNETNAILGNREERYRAYSGALANSSIVAAGTRLFLSMISKSQWTFTPSEADRDGTFAELAETALTSDPSTPWHRIVRRAAMFRFYGFSVQEWTAKRRDNGAITFADIAPRAQRTISRWDVDTDGTVRGIVQESPQDFKQIYIPRSKCLYLVDDSLNDSPEGLGIFRHLVELTKRLDRYEQLEGIGFETDLRGIPIGRGPFSELNEMVTTGKITNAQRLGFEAPLRAFIENHIKSEKLGLLLDSKTYESQDESSSPSSQLQWTVELLKGGSTSFAENAAAIERINKEMARVLNVEQLMLGSGEAGSFALSKDKTNSFLSMVDSVLMEIAESVESDLIGTLWELNGWPKEMKPDVQAGTVQQAGVEQITAALRDLATAGVLVGVDDPVVDDIRDILGVSRAPDESMDRDIDAGLQSTTPRRTTNDDPIDDDVNLDGVN